jgi:hypothetical protein
MFLFAPLVLAAAAPFAGQTTIPFTYVDNRIVIECRIDGEGPLTMILDTGSPSIAVTPETAARLAVPVHDAGTVTGAGNEVAKNGRAALATLSLGNLTFKNLNADVLDLTEIRTKLHFPHLDGIIGYPILLPQTRRRRTLKESFPRSTPRSTALPAKCWSIPAIAPR